MKEYIIDLYLNIIKMFLNKEIYLKYVEYVDKEYLRRNYPELLKIFYTLEVLHDNSTKETKDTVDLEAIFLAGYPKSERETFEPIFKKIGLIKEENEESISKYLQSLVVRQKASEMAFVALDIAEGKAKKELLEPLIITYQESVKESNENEEDNSSEEWVNDDIEELYNKAVAEPGLSWRLGSLRRSLGPLRKGDFGFIFARPETGKTTFLASECTHFAGQTESPILWLNNEETDDKVLLRCYTVCIGYPLERILSNREKARSTYYERTRRNIKLPLNFDNTKSGIERMCKRVKPALIVIDQLDKVGGFDADREDLRMGAIYEWARQLAKDYCPVIGVSQADGSGEGEKWLSMGNVANAKTAKQGPADWILGIGVSYMDPPNVRGFSVCKNKLIGGEETIPDMRHGKWEVLIEPLIGRYKDVK